MASVTIISVGTIKDSFLKDAIAEYKKKLSRYARLEEIEIKEERITNEDDKSEIERALSLEGEKITAKIPEGSMKIALCVEGRQYDSLGLAKLMESGVDSPGKLTFIIGSSHGLSDTVKAKADIKLSFSKMTFPHQLMKVMLLEAVYRSFTIISGAKYHK